MSHTRISPRAGDPARAVLTGGVLGGCLALLAATLCCAIIFGGGPAASALAGSFISLVVLTVAGMAFAAMLRLGGGAPLPALLGAFLAFLTPMVAIGVLFVLLEGLTWFNAIGFTVGVLGVALAFQVGALLSYRRSRILVYDLAPTRPTREQVSG